MGKRNTAACWRRRRSCPRRPPWRSSGSPERNNRSRGTAGRQQAAAVRSAEAGQYQSEMSGAYAFVPTTDRVLSLALHGIGDLDGMMRLLDVLDESGTKATFFLPGMRLAEEPEIAREIADRGHELGNLTLNGLDMRGLDHERVYDEIHLANEVIWKAAGLFPRYVSTRNGEYTDDVRRAAAQLGMEAVIAGNLRIGARTAGEDLRSFIRSRMTRGGIIEVIVDQYPDPEAAVRAVVETAAEIGYELVTLSSLMAHQETLVRAEEIPGYDAAAIQPDYRRDAFRVVRKVQTDDRVVSLTFDDWGSDYTVTKTLDILERYGVKATFFLRAGGVEYNPNLARAIARAGRRGCQSYLRPCGNHEDDPGGAAARYRPRPPGRSRRRCSSVRRCCSGRPGARSTRGRRGSWPRPAIRSSSTTMSRRSTGTQAAARRICSGRSARRPDPAASSCSIFWMICRRSKRCLPSSNI